VRWLAAWNSHQARGVRQRNERPRRIDRGVIVCENRYLERKFGTPYADYKRRVRRWM
jgi:protein-S-isoprenylcysteine O-methyltransferase Ste14